jgi:hypothetical protein
MSKILSIIPQQSFEIIRDRIGFILADEIAGQYTLTSNDNINATVWIERKAPFDKTDCPAINISFSNGTYDNKNARSVDGSYTYNIDIYTSAKNTISTNADSTAAVNNMRLLGICRAILENPIYRTLDYSPPILCHTEVRQIGIPEMDIIDANTTCISRLVFFVIMPETVSLLTALQLSGSDTVIKLYLTNKGYKFIAGIPILVLNSIVINSENPAGTYETIIDCTTNADANLVIEFYKSNAPAGWVLQTNISDGVSTKFIIFGNIGFYTKARLNYNNGQAYSNEITDFNGQSN